MSDTVSINWLFPPNWSGSYAKGIGFRKMAIRLTNVSDGTGESNVVKVNKSELRTSRGIVPKKLVIEKIDYSCSGMSVKLSFDRDPDEVIAVLASDGCKDWTKQGGFPDPGDVGSGDILLTTVGHTSGDTYDVTIHFRLK